MEWTPEQIDRYDKMLVLEAAGELPADALGKLNVLRQVGEVPPLPAWPGDHPHIRAAEQKYGIPTGQLGAILGPENAQGSTTARSPTDVTGLFQVTVTKPDSPGKRFGLNLLNRTNPYMNTDVAAKEFKRLLDLYGGDPHKALVLGYKGHGSIDMSDEEYLRRYDERLAQLSAGGSATGAPSPAPALLPTPPDPRALNTTPPLPATATTTSPTSQTFGQEVRSRAGFGTDRAPAGVGLLGQTVDNLNLGPLGPLLKMVSAATDAPVGAAVSQLGGSHGAPESGAYSAGNLAQLLTAFFGGRAITPAGPRTRAAAELERLGVLNPGRTADTMTDAAAGLTQTAVREGPARLGITPQTVEQATGRAINEAQTTATRMNAAAVKAARESDAAGVVPTPTTGTPARTVTSPIVNERGVPYTRREPAVPPRSVTSADVPPDLAGERAITRTLSDAAQHFQRYVDKASDAATPQSAINLLLRGAKTSGFGKAGVKLPMAEAAKLELQVSQLVEKMVTASPEQGVRLLERAATLKGLDVPELAQAKALLADAEKYRGQAAEVAARMDALNRYLQSPSILRRMTGVLLPTPVRKLLGAAGMGAAAYAGAKAAGAGSSR